MTAPLCFKCGLDETEFEGCAGSVRVDLRPYREAAASAYLDFSEAVALRDWLNGWIAANAPAEPET